MRRARSVVAVAVLAAACSDGGGGGGRTSEAGVIRSDVARAAVDDAATAAVASAVGAFGVDLYLDVAGRRAGENVVVSPVSVHIALAMTRVGAAGTTAAELDDALHAGGDELADGWNGLLQALMSRAGTREDVEGNEVELVLTSADAVWAQDGLGLEDGFLDVLASRYDAGVNTVDFEQTEDARAAINDWVAERTNQRIPELIPEGILSLDSRLVLTNALYLNAPWREPFFEESTEPAPFHRLAGSDVTVPMMRSGRSIPYSTGEGWQATALDYVGGELEMVLVLPDEGRFDAVESSLAEVLDATGAGDRRQVVVGLPRFELRAAASLREALEALGIEALFDPERADLSGMTSEEDLFVSAVVHEVFVAVDEKGTEAAAATAVVGAGGAAPAEPVEMVLDRPFLFAVRDVATGTPLFLGRILDPTA